MAKRKLHIVLPPYVWERLNTEANQRGQTAADLGAFWIQHQMELKKLLPNVSTGKKVDLSELIKENFFTLRTETGLEEQFLIDLVNGNKIPDDFKGQIDKLRIATALNMSEDEINELANKGTKEKCNNK